MVVNTILSDGGLSSIDAAIVVEDDVVSGFATRKSNSKSPDLSVSRYGVPGDQNRAASDAIRTIRSNYVTPFKTQVSITNSRTSSRDTDSSTSILA